MRAVTHQVAAFMLEYKTFYITSKLLLLKNKGGGAFLFCRVIFLSSSFPKNSGGGGKEMRKNNLKQNKIKFQKDGGEGRIFSTHNNQQKRSKEKEKGKKKTGIHVLNVCPSGFSKPVSPGSFSLLLLKL